MVVLNIAVIGSDELARSIAKAADQRDVHTYIHKENGPDGARILSLIRPAKFPERLSPFLNALSTSQAGGQMKASMQDPAELLPKDSNTEFAKSNPSGMGHLKGVSLLTPQEQIGINSVGQCNRNPNLQLRGDPNIPKRHTGPWNQSTIEHCSNNSANVFC